MEQKETYNKILLEHNLYPNNQGVLDKKTIERQLINASCGDKISVQLDIQNGIIRDGRFSGMGCAISLASADLMIDAIRGRTLEDAIKIKENIEKIMIGEESNLTDMGELMALCEISRMPARLKCASLAWQIIDIDVKSLRLK